MFAPSLDHPVINMCFYFAKTEIRSDFKCVFIELYIKKLPIAVSHNFTVLSWINYPPVTTTKPYFFISLQPMKCQRFYIYNSKA